MAFSDLRYCPRCAGRLEWRAFQYSDVHHPVCTNCGFILWQNPKPCVDALIIRGNGARVEVLLGRRLAEPYSGLWDIPGGFLNVGDHLEETLVRECKREMDIEVAVQELIGAFDDMFFDTQIVTLIFACKIVSGEPRAADIIDEVKWFSLFEPPPTTPVISQAIAKLNRHMTK